MASSGGRPDECLVVERYVAAALNASGSKRPIDLGRLEASVIERYVAGRYGAVLGDERFWSALTGVGLHCGRWATNR